MRLKTAFKDRVAAGPHNWILSQQLGTRKQRPNELLDTFVTDITRHCKRLGLSDANSMRHFIDGLQSVLQTYVGLHQICKSKIVGGRRPLLQMNDKFLSLTTSPLSLLVFRELQGLLHFST